MAEFCEMPLQNASSTEVDALLKESKTVAVVGISDKPDRDSHRVAAYLQTAGYTIIPVNPSLTEVLGQKCYPSLKNIPISIDIVDIFRKPEAVPDVVAEAIAVKAKAIWMQEGIAHNAAADQARAAGLKVVMNKCMLREHLRSQAAR